MGERCPGLVSFTLFPSPVLLILQGILCPSRSVRRFPFLPSLRPLAFRDPVVDSLFLFRSEVGSLESEVREVRERDVDGTTIKKVKSELKCLNDSTNKFYVSVSTSVTLFYLLETIYRSDLLLCRYTQFLKNFMYYKRTH